jgi:hypothetical protein
VVVVPHQHLEEDRELLKGSTMVPRLLFSASQRPKCKEQERCYGFLREEKRYQDGDLAPLPPHLNLSGPIVQRPEKGDMTVWTNLPG